MANYSISINDELAEIVEKEMKKGRYENRSEFFRELIREKYVEGQERNFLKKLKTNGRLIA